MIVHAVCEGSFSRSSLDAVLQHGVDNGVDDHDDEHMVQRLEVLVGPGQLPVCMCV